MRVGDSTKPPQFEGRGTRSGKRAATSRHFLSSTLRLTTTLLWLEAQGAQLTAARAALEIGLRFRYR